MPLKDLKAYKGISVKPADFDQYWERAIRDLDVQPLDYELHSADINAQFADCFHLYFTGIGGAKVHCKLIRPKKAGHKGPGLLMFHGYHTNSGDWLEKLAFAAQGFTVMAMDCRGQGGGLSEDRLTVKGGTLKGHIIRGVQDPNPDNLYYRQVFLDTVQAARIMMSMEQVDPERIAAFGMSQGGALTLACAALEPKIKIAAAGYPFLADYKRVWEMDILNSAYEEIAYYFRHFDPTHEREEAIFERLGYIDIQNLADRIKADVLFGTGLIDNRCPPSTQFAVFNKIQSAKNMLIYYEHAHEDLPQFKDKVFQMLTSI
ncbi:acetylxylan esterase [Metabacillus sp. RGM 3146]|uniref:acetylxylan esterase n=1 Tax=Metabacillus sp. RGM 3146 TaxID=3401092 RepID=UPI003B9D38E1